MITVTRFGKHKDNFDYQLPLRQLMYRTTVRVTAPF